MTGRSHDSILCRFAADSAQKKLHALLKERDGVVSGEDIESIHRMRVASRRLRVTLDLFRDCFPERRGREWRRSVRRLTRALGAARDRDVQLAYLVPFAASLQDELRPGAERLKLRLEQDRAALQGGVLEALDRFEAGDTVLELETACARLRQEGRRDREAENAVSVIRLGAGQILARLDKLLAFEICVRNATLRDEHHAMRIAAKRLRYAMEIFDPVFENALHPALKAVRDVQERLGGIHDCDVWAGLVDEMTETERLRTVEFFGHLNGFSELLPGFEAVRDDRARTRVQLHTQFTECWESLDKNSVWLTLKNMIEARTITEGK